jgi:nuclear transcription factor Y gamma
LLETENWRILSLPLARIKKIMRCEEFVMRELEKERLLQAGETDSEKKPKPKFMISGDAPIIMTKACELLIKELSTRAWQHTYRNRRRTLQRADLHAAVGESEVFDFLIDIVPRVSTSPQPAAAIEQPASLDAAARAAAIAAAAAAAAAAQNIDQTAAMAAAANAAAMATVTANTGAGDSSSMFAVASPGDLGQLQDPTMYDIFQQTDANTSQPPSDTDQSQQQQEQPQLQQEWTDPSSGD